MKSESCGEVRDLGGSSIVAECERPSYRLGSRSRPDARTGRTRPGLSFLAWIPERIFVSHVFVTAKWAQRRAPLVLLRRLDAHPAEHEVAWTPKTSHDQDLLR